MDNYIYIYIYKQNKTHTQVFFSFSHKSDFTTVPNAHDLVNFLCVIDSNFFVTGRDLPFKLRNISFYVVLSRSIA